MKNTFDDLMTTHDPARGFANYTAADRDRVIATAIEADIATADVIPLTGRKPRRPRLWARWVTVAAAALLALALVLVPGLGLVQGGATAEAADVLDKAIIRAVDPPTRPDQYWKITTNSVTSDIIGDGGWGDSDTTSMLRKAQRITWVAVDGSRPSWFVDRTGPYVRQVSGPATALPKVGWKTSETWTTNLSERKSGVIDILGLPTKASDLRAELYRIGHGLGASDDEEVVTMIGDILRSGYAPAALRKALFEVMKTVPGVSVVNQNVTLDGRKGVALGRAEAARDQVRQELIFDRTTGEFIGERTVYPSLNASLDSAVSRELVDTVDPKVVAAATHYQCEAQPSGPASCQPR